MLHLTIVTPERFLEDESLSVTAPGALGEMQILEGHSALLAELAAGVLSYENKNREAQKLMIGEGVIEVDNNRVTILCEEAFYKSEIDKAKEENLLSSLNDQIKGQVDEQKQITLLLKRSMAKLRLLE